MCRWCARPLRTIGNTLVDERSGMFCRIAEGGRHVLDLSRAALESWLAS